MNVVPDEHGPVLGGVGGLVDFLRDHPAQPGLLGEPLPRGPRDGVPAEHDGAGLAVYVDVAGRDHVGLLAEAELLLDLELALQEAVLPVGAGFMFSCMNGDDGGDDGCCLVCVRVCGVDE